MVLHLEECQPPSVSLPTTGDEVTGKNSLDVKE